MPKGQVKLPSPVWRIRASRGTLPTLVFNIFFFFFYSHITPIHHPVWRGSPYDPGTQGKANYKPERKRNTKESPHRHRRASPTDHPHPTPHSSLSNQAKKSSTRSTYNIRPPSSYSYRHKALSSISPQPPQIHPLSGTHLRQSNTK